MKRSTKLSLYLSVSLAIVFALMVVMGFFKTQDIHSRLKILADATAIPALLSLGIFGLLRIGQSGLFDIFGYSVSRLSSLFIPRHQVAHTSYCDYKTKAKSKGASLNILLFVGIALLLCSVLLTILYYKA